MSYAYGPQTMWENEKTRERMDAEVIGVLVCFNLWAASDAAEEKVSLGFFREGRLANGFSAPVKKLEILLAGIFKVFLEEREDTFYNLK